MIEATDPETKPNELIATLGDDLLSRFKSAPLLDEYDVYERLMTYWHGTMHDDVFLVMSNGWLDAARPRKARVVAYDKNKKPKYEDADIQVGTGAQAQRFVMDLLPPVLVISRFLADKQSRVDELRAASDAASQALDEYLQDHAVEDGLLWEAVDDKEKVTQKSAAAALKEATAVADEEAARALSRVIALIKDETAAKKATKEAQGALDLEALKKYGDLTESEVRTLVLDDKWATSITDRVIDEVNALTLALVARIQQLGDRYAETLDDLDAQLATLADRVAGSSRWMVRGVS